MGHNARTTIDETNRRSALSDRRQRFCGQDLSLDPVRLHTQREGLFTNFLRFMHGQVYPIH